jgi:hypothetical protein
VVALAILAAVYGLPATSGTPLAPPPPLPGAERLLAAGPHPQVTTLYDWDPQPFVVPPTFPLGEIAGEGASMATSDPYGTVLLFGGLSSGGLTNLTVLANETTGVWSVVSTPTAPSPRTNASLAVTGDGQFAVLFGGEVNAATQAVDNQTWVFSFIHHTWTNVSQPVAPAPRESAAFAIDPADDVALLEGGWEPTASVRGGGATVIWNDTWTLNLTSDNWSQVNDPTAPRPMYGSAMVFDPVNSTFLLFGGCPGIGICSAGLLQYRLGHNWSLLPTNGDIPPARGAASMVWSDTWQLVFMFGGFQFAGNNYLGLNDTYVYDPDGRSWSAIVGAGPPGRFDAASAFLGNNGCPGMLVVGGSYALTAYPPDGWFMDANPDIGSGCNIWGGDENGGSSGPPPGPCTPVINITVALESSVTHLGIPNGSVTSVGKCGTTRATTGPLGSVVFDLPNENVTFSALAALFHSASVRVNTTSLPTPTVPILLTPLPVITFYAQAENPGTFPDAFVPLPGVLIAWVGGAVGITNFTGGLIDFGFPGAQGATTFEGTRPYYSNATATALIPYTGKVWVNLTLLADGLFSVQAYEYPDGQGIVNATGIIAPVGAFTYGGPIYFTTGPSGWFNISLPQANYTVFVSHPGFQSNSTHGAVFHAWRTPTVVMLSLTLAYGSNVSVQLLSSATHDPIPAGVVTIGYFPMETTSDRGWANFTDLLPPGEYNVSGSAAGFRPNSTTVDLTYLHRFTNLTLYLTPMSLCSPECVVNPNGTSGGYQLLPGSGAALDLYIVAPLALAVGAAIYITYLRRPESEGRPA